MWLVYILRSVSSGKLYTGITNNLSKRLLAHNKGTGAKCTRAGRPWVVVYQEPARDKSEALKREIVIKKKTRAEKLNLIRGYTLNRPLGSGPTIPS